MSNVTFITGLPRSRTAWLGTYAMAHGAIVVHEPLRFCNPELLEEVFSVVEEVPLVFAGYDLIANYDKLKDMGKWLIVQRDLEEVIVSGADKFLEDPDLLSTSQKHIDSATFDGACFVDYEELENMDVMQHVHKYIFGDSVPFSLRKFLTLTDFYIEPHEAKYAAKTHNARRFFDDTDTCY